MASSRSPTSPTEPLPRYRHFSGAIGRKVWIYGGQFDKDNAELPTTVHLFDVASEKWREAITSGEHPPQSLWDGASCTSPENHIYLCSSRAGSDYHGCLYKYSNPEWTLLSTSGGKDAPILKRACGMIYNQDRIILFGGLGARPTGPTQPGADYEGYVKEVFTNELHLFDCRKSESICS